MMIAVALVIIMAAISIPWFIRLQRQNALARVARDLVGTLQLARAEAASGKDLDAGPGIRRARFAGVRITSNTTYELFVDEDSDPTNSNGQTIDQIDLLALNRGNTALITAPAANTEIRFKPDGTIAGVGTSIVIEDAHLKERRTIAINTVGHIRTTESHF
jgi:Tfp pilus assembly protein FimT